MKKIKVVIFILLLVLCLNVKAEDSCQNDELKRLNELANNVNIKYTYELETEIDGDFEYKYFLYKLNVINFSDDLVLVRDDERVSKEELENIYFLEGDNLKFNIYSYTDNLCTHKNLRTISLNFPYYNDYYESHKEECDRYSSFKYCNEFFDEKIELSTEEIDELFIKYKNDINKDNIEKEQIKIYNFIKNNKVLFLIIGLGIVIIPSIIFIVINKRKNRDI